MAAAGIDDDACVFPSLGEALAGGGLGELGDEVVEIAEVFEQGGGVGGDFLEQGAAVDYLAAGLGEEGLEGGDGGGERGDAGGGDAAGGGSGLGGGGLSDVADGFGLGDEVEIALAGDVGHGEVDLAAAVGIARFAEVAGAGAGERVGEGFEGGFGEGLFIGTAAGGGHGEGVGGGNLAVSGGEGGEVFCKGDGFLAVPERFVIVTVGGGDAGAHHVELVLQA